MKTSIERMREHKDELYELMPPSAQTLVDVLGMNAALSLIERFGGLDYHVPKSLHADSAKRLAEVIGVSATKAFIHHYGGERVYINRCDSLRVYLRNQAFFSAMLAKMEAGMSQTAAIHELAPVFNFSERHAYNIIKECSEKRYESSLF